MASLEKASRQGAKSAKQTNIEEFLGGLGGFA
jgi:hypothetical protein